MNFLRFPLWLRVLCLALTSISTRAEEPFAKKHLEASLVADTSAIKAGRPFTVGVHFKMDAGWHLYWRYSGEAGAPPRIEWELPEGFTAAPPQWPAPTAHLDAGGLLTYIYEEELVLPVEITPPAQLPAGEVMLRAKLRWLICAEICVPGQATVELKLPTGEAAAANTELFAPWRARLPKTGGEPFAATWDRSRAEEVSVQVSGLAPGAKVELFPLPPPSVKTGQPQLSEVAADGSRTITFPLTEGGAPNLAWSGVLAISRDGQTRESWLVSSANAPTSAAQISPPSAAKADGSLVWKLCAAFLGGLIMNVMPCVLPVITLKIFGFVSQAGEDPRRVFRLGLAFVAGVFAFFLGLAAIVANLKGAFNWGYQFQNPYLLAGLIALIFVFSLNLLGVFEIALTGGAASKLSELSSREGAGGAFLHGLFTTLLGTSCTAPFLGTSLGFAVTQSTPIIFLLFLAIAAGMSAPYFLLTARPAWMRYLPKPGLWMERARQGMGFIMLAVGVWLFGVLALRGPGVVAGMSWFLLTLGAGAWLFGILHGSWLARLAALALPLLGYGVFLHPALAAPLTPRGALAVEAGGIAWEPYSEERLAAAQKAGQPVFIDFTAEWCVNCKFYEKTVLETPAVREKFRAKKVVALRADWTNTDDPVVTKALKSFGRVGVPLYVLYRPGEAAPLVQDALTKDGLLRELDQLAD